MSTKEKRRALVALYRNRLSSPYFRDILQVVRYSNDLEEEVGGWGNLWTAYYQYVLKQNGLEGSQDFEFKRFLCHYTLAIFLAFSSTSSMPPHM